LVVWLCVVFVQNPEEHILSLRRRFATLRIKYFNHPPCIVPRYTVTDVKDLGEWHDRHASAHAMFEKVPAAELASDPAVPIVLEHTEEGKKVAALG
jgi:hypothetical protein